MMRKRMSILLFVLGFAVLAAFNRIDKIISLPPQSLHLWRQCDCISFSLRFYDENRLFWEPAIHHLGRDGTGQTASEFPLIYYINAKLWKLTGIRFETVRIINLLIFIGGLLIFCYAATHFLEDSFYAAYASLFLLTSPVIVFYSANFLSDISALGLAIAGLGYLILYFQFSKTKYLYYVTLLFTIAGLLKISALIGLSAAIILLAHEYLPGGRIGPKIAPNTYFRQFLLLVIPILIACIWIFYAYSYNIHHNSGYFLQGILPIWKMNRQQITETWQALGEHMRWDYFRLETNWLLLAVALLVLVSISGSRHKRLTFLLFYTLLIIAVYIILFFEALKDHDYYTINLFIAIPLLLLIVFAELRFRFPRAYKSLILKIILLAFFVHQADFTRRRMAGRYNPDSWQNKQYREIYFPMKHISSRFGQIGINPSDTILVLTDNSINISLVAANRKGWTNYGINRDTTIIREKIRAGASFIIAETKDSVLRQYTDRHSFQKLDSCCGLIVYKVGLKSQRAADI